MVNNRIIQFTQMFDGFPPVPNRSTCQQVLSRAEAKKSASQKLKAAEAQAASPVWKPGWDGTSKATRQGIIRFFWVCRWRIVFFLGGDLNMNSNRNIYRNQDLHTSFGVETIHQKPGFGLVEDNVLASKKVGNNK